MSVRHARGFTLVELLIVVAILAIIAAIALPQFGSAQSETRESSLAANLAALRRSIELYTLHHDDTPPGATIATQLTTQTNEDGTPGTKYGPYIRRVPENAVNKDSTFKTVASMPAAPSGTEGWIYDTTTGELRANAAGTGPSGTDYFDL